MTKQTNPNRQPGKRSRKQRPENTYCANRAKIVVRIYRIVSGTDRGDAITDLLTDLMHFCDEKRLNFNEQLTRAEMHYEGELTGEESPALRPHQNGGAKGAR